MKKTTEITQIIRLYVLIQAFGCCLMGKVAAQSALLQTSISVQCTDTPLGEILHEIRHNYRIPFSYFKEQLPLQKKITLAFHNEPLQRVLDSVSMLAGIRYQAIGGQIVLKESTKNQPAMPASGSRSSAKQLSSTAGPKEAANKNHLHLTSSHSFSGPAPVNTIPAKPGNRITNKHMGKQPEKLPARGLRSQTKTGRSEQLLLWQKKQELGSLVPVKNPYPAGALPAGAIPAISAVIPVPVTPPVKSVYTRSRFQMALLPGISTHGIHPGEFINAVSVNIFAGYSAGNQLIEVGGLSNFNQNHVSGVQISGLANVTGGNKFVGLTAQEKQKLKKENTDANLQGIQLAGLTNITGGNVFGWQTTGGINVVKKSLQGVQLAGISNLVQTYAFGIQLAGISNASMESVDGVQVAALYNYTDGELHGIQVGAFNQAGEIEGKHSRISVSHTGLQIGLLNTARRMNGFQLGLINIGSEMAGTQIGLINLNAGKQGKGLPIGLLNLNTKNEFFRIYTSELFAGNLEISTGSLRIQNMVSIGFNPVTMADFYRPKWSAGYSLGQIKRPRKDFFYSYDAGIAHLNQGMKPVRQLSLLARARATAGHKIELRKVVFHVFGGITFNTYFAGNDQPPVSPAFLRIYEKNTGSSHIEMWPGFVAGIHL